MPFVVDASVTVAWLMPDERHVKADHAFQRLGTDHALVPTLWWYETRNVFLMNERRGRIDGIRTSRALAVLAELPIREDRGVNEHLLLDVARRHSLTVYDAAYLELAARRGLPLATLDSALASAAFAEGVEIVQ